MQAKRSWISATLLIFMLLAMADDSWGITIRDDRNDSQYTALANTAHPYGGVIWGNGWLGSGTLISPNWVLTAGHVLSGDITFQTTAGTYSVVQQVPYGSLDIGLARLSSPITTIEPVKLYDLIYGVEDGQDSIILGAGQTGTGETGQQGAAGTRRAADTYVYANASAWDWGSENLLTWFRSPENGAANLEGGSALGDSGGGLLLNVNGEYAIAGVMSLAWSGGSGGSVIGQYDTGGVYVRSAPLNDWITQYATDAVVVSFVPGSWSIDGSGDWNDGANWIGGVVPNSNTAVAILGSEITSSRTVFTNAAVTVKSVQFDNANTYAIAGGGSVNLEADAGNASIAVLQGSHEFQTVVNLVTNTDVNVAATSSLSFNNALNLGGLTLTKTGAGTLNINSALNSGTGSVVVSAGTVGGSGEVGGDLTNSGGTVALGTSPGKLSVAGDYLQTSGSLLVEIDGTTAESEYDVLDVTGSLTMSGGSLDVVLGFTPAVSDTFDILNFASANGAGVTLNLGSPAGSLVTWDSSQLFVNGSLSVLAIVTPREWATDGSGDWNSGSNWVSGSVPNSNTETTFFGDAITAVETVFTNTAVTVKGVQFDNANTYVIAGTGSVNLEADAGNASIAVLQGSHEFQTVVNLVTNTDVNVAATSSLSFNNALNLGGLTLTKTGDGTMNINNQLNTGGGSVLISAGALGGSGEIIGDLSNIGGTLAPGNSPGVMTIDGDYTQGTEGTLLIELSGTEVHDLLIVTGTADLAGALDVVLLSGFEPALGDHFSILEFGSTSSTFDAVSLPSLGGGLTWDESSLYSVGTLSVIPEPSSLVLLCIMLGGILLQRRPAPTIFLSQAGAPYQAAAIHGDHAAIHA